MPLCPAFLRGRRTAKSWPATGTRSLSGKGCATMLWQRCWGASAYPWLIGCHLANVVSFSSNAFVLGPTNWLWWPIHLKFLLFLLWPQSRRLTLQTLVCPMIKQSPADPTPRQPPLKKVARYLKLVSIFFISWGVCCLVFIHLEVFWQQGCEGFISACVVNSSLRLDHHRNLVANNHQYRPLHYRHCHHLHHLHLQRLSLPNLIILHRTGWWLHGGDPIWSPMMALMVALQWKWRRRTLNMRHCSTILQLLRTETKIHVPWKAFITVTVEFDTFWNSNIFQIMDHWLTTYKVPNNIDWQLTLTSDISFQEQSINTKGSFSQKVFGKIRVSYWNTVGHPKAGDLEWQWHILACTVLLLSDGPVPAQGTCQTSQAPASWLVNVSQSGNLRQTVTDLDHWWLTDLTDWFKLQFAQRIWPKKSLS